jgi:hypothetical protein
VLVVVLKVPSHVLSEGKDRNRASSVQPGPMGLGTRDHVLTEQSLSQGPGQLAEHSM